MTLGSTGSTGSTGATGDSGETKKDNNVFNKTADISGVTINGNNWGAFVMSLLTYFVITLLFGLFGCGFIYLTTRGSDLDNIFPTDEDFYSNKKYRTNKAGASNMDGCNEVSTGSFAVFEHNFPYNLIKVKGASKAELDGLSIVDRMCNWFAKTVAGCFKSNRALLKGWLDSFSPEGGNLLANNAFQILIAAPFTIFISFSSLFTGFFAALGSMASSDMKVTVWGGFLFYSWALSFGLGFIMFLRLVGTLLFYGISQNWKEVSNIMACNVKPLVALFGFFVCGSAYDTLDPVIAGMMGITYLILVCHAIWKLISGQLH